ncbi:MAG: protein kinase [Polyangiaceae bacterium]
MGTALTAAEFFEAKALPPDAELSGDELVRAFWTVRGQAKELARKERFWAATNDALADAYRELAERTAELQAARNQVEELNRALEARVSKQVEELVRRSKEIRSLDVRLRERMVSRSDELAKAVQRFAQENVVHVGPGHVLGERVRVECLLATGGMGAVFAATDLETHERVAVKVLLPGHEANAEIVRRFLQEAGAASRIHHPAIVRTLLVDVTTDGRAFHVMELVEGIDLSRYAQGRSLATAEIAHVGLLVAEALAAAHAAGVVHRDIKPSNVMLCAGDVPLRILDFGVSKVEDQESAAGSQPFVGTPAYASPEQLAGHRVGSASDIYSLGITLYELLTGARPTQRWLSAFATQERPSKGGGGRGVTFRRVSSRWCAGASRQTLPYGPPPPRCPSRSRAS